VNKKIIKVKQLQSQKAAGFDSLEILATFCYYFPQYTLQEARSLPYRHINRMLKVAMKHKALEYLNLTQIASAPHTEKGKGVTELINNYKEQL